MGAPEAEHRSAPLSLSHEVLYKEVDPFSSLQPNDLKGLPTVLTRDETLRFLNPMSSAYKRMT